MQEVGEAGNSQKPIYTQRPQLAADQTDWLLRRHIEINTIIALNLRVEHDGRNNLLIGIYIVITLIQIIKESQGQKISRGRYCIAPSGLCSSADPFVYQTFQLFRLHAPDRATSTTISHGPYDALNAAMWPLLCTSRVAKVSFHCCPCAIEYTGRSSGSVASRYLVLPHGRTGGPR